MGDIPTVIDGLGDIQDGPCSTPGCPRLGKPHVSKRDDGDVPRMEYFCEVHWPDDIPQVTEFPKPV